MENKHEISEDRLFFFEREVIVIDDFEAAGFILDIGGGGEGIIGRLKGKQVIAIDPSRSELAEAAKGPLKIVMNAAELQFLNQSFNTVTSFYTLVYIKEAETLKKIFSEVYRALTAGGRFLVWDGILPRRVEKDKDMAAFLLTVKLGEERVDTGYGGFWPEDGRRESYYMDLAKSAGFEVVLQKVDGLQLFLEMRKPHAQATEQKNE